MANFAQWFIDFFKKFFEDVWTLIKGFFLGFYNLFVGFPIEYVKTFREASQSFSFLDWLLSIFFILIFVFLILMFYIVLIQLIRRYFRFSKIEYDKMTLLNQINHLERKIRSGRFTQTKESSTSPLTLAKPKQQIAKGSRFTKLNLIDEKYKYTVLPTYMEESDKLTLNQLINHFRNYASHHHKLYYNEEVMATFIAGMATSKLIIIEGISGTGKTSLPYVFGKFISNDCKIISVQPSWRDRFEMMGYFNEFTKKFNETEFLSSIYEATYRTDINVILLDEMNLARVEYYFADFLSLLELPSSDEWLLEIVPEQLIGDPMNLKEGNIKIPENIWFVGTANNDDSTFAITDKVYDRASTIVLNERATPFSAPDTSNIKISYDFLRKLFMKQEKKITFKKKSLIKLNMLNKYITKKYKITFGNRIMKQLLEFVPVYIACGRSEIEGIDYLIARKIIRKFESLNLPFLKTELEELLTVFDDLFGDAQLVKSSALIREYIKRI